MSSPLFARLIRPVGQSRSAKTVEVFGWILLAEAPLVLLAPHWVAEVLHLPELGVQAANYFRLVGLLIGGLGMLYVVSGRLDAQGFVFASMLDRPLVPFIMAALWAFGLIPGTLALFFAVSDSVSVLWTWSAWRREHRGP
ncbi:hypothetical protein [Denitromonas iodatirespirans]|uniref:Uncharacterized protein n=1 Tax=Denitromonas iodatirespirans TaxID=2795389 RepID=A0A944H6C4_DENI1|nr:hypothetical protein [Denitromonas iodatirespirans]MBT0960023.1 hypothetical protein [Denitromonas iodatirespirans]